MWNSFYREIIELSRGDHSGRNYRRKRQALWLGLALSCAIQFVLIKPSTYYWYNRAQTSEHTTATIKEEAPLVRRQRVLREDDMVHLVPTVKEFWGPDVCDRVMPYFPKEAMFQEQCNEYERLPSIVPATCTPDEVVIPKILHTVSASNYLPPHYYITAKANPDFQLKHHSDDSALEFIKLNCGEDVASAYTCLKAPAFRADLFRFCALVSDGGVYLDSDIVPLLKLEDIYSPCATATLGYDIPQYDDKSKMWNEGKQMKILAAAPGAPVFQCMLDKIVESARRGSIPWSPLAVSGPLLLHECYEEFPARVAVTYKDTRNALWPFTGLRRGREMVAYEVASNRFFDDAPTIDYGKLFDVGEVYEKNCPLQKEFTFPSVEERVEYYMGDWYEEREFDVDVACAHGFFNDTEWREKQLPKLYTSKFLRRVPGIQFDDVRYYMFPYWNTKWAIYLLHMGEKASPRHRAPVISASRPLGSSSTKDRQDGKVGPILAPMMTIRHTQYVNELAVDDILWEKKTASLVWRGKSTTVRDGRREKVLAAILAGFNVRITELAGNCEECVKKDIELRGDHLFPKDQLKHKYLLSMEGLGASSGLGWMLASNSVVFMSKPTRATWLMEDILVPWYHYIPVKSDLSDLEKKVEWAKRHDAFCKRIADNASEYMRNLWTTSKAEVDTKKIMFRLVDRYRALYGLKMQKCLEDEDLEDSEDPDS